MSFSKPVSIGDWWEMSSEEEAEAQEYFLNRGRCIDVEKICHLLKNVLKEVKLQGSKEGLKYGDIVQIESAATPKGFKCSETRLVLSVLVDEFDAKATANIRPGCTLTGSPVKTPCIRNAFRIGSYDEYPDGEFVRYNNCITLSTLPSHQTPNHYIICEYPFFHSPIGESSRPILRLGDELAEDCRWKIMRPRKEKPSGTDDIVLPNSSVVIRHLDVNENLTSEFRFKIKTLFGKEYEVGVQNHYDQSNEEKLSNLWFFNVEHTPAAY